MSTLQDKVRTKVALGNAGFWTLVAGGTLGAATLVYGLVTRGKAPPPTSGWRVLPAVTGDGGGVLVMGAF